MKKFYKIIDDKGRIQLPNEIKKEADLNNGDIVTITIDGMVIKIKKTDIIDLRSESKDMLEARIIAAFKLLDQKDEKRVLKRIIEISEKKEGR